MINIRCNETEKDKAIALLNSFKEDSVKKKNIDILIDALEVYKEYRKRVKAKVEKAALEVWGEE